MLTEDGRDREVEFLAQAYAAARSGGQSLRLGLSESEGTVSHLVLHLSKMQIPGLHPRILNCVLRGSGLGLCRCKVTG